MKDKSLKEIAKKVVDSNYFVLIAVWIIMCIVFTKLQSNFFSYRNMLNILTSGSLVGLLCIGEAYLIIAGMIELSAGAVAAFSGVLGGDSGAGRSALGGDPAHHHRRRPAVWPAERASGDKDQAAAIYHHAGDHVHRPGACLHHLSG